MSSFRDAFLALNDVGYRRVARPLIFRSSAQASHQAMIRLLGALDNRPAAALLGLLHQAAFEAYPVEVGGVKLPDGLILAAGLVKGEGFATEGDALAAVQAGRNIIPGWRSMPSLAGAVEVGSFTRHPRMGNPGVVIWRDAGSQSTQNRVGLKNPGARAAAAFLAARRDHLPECYGINIAVSPGVTDLAQEKAEAEEALNLFLDAKVLPSWFTLNLSCPNTEDDPRGHQTKTRTRDLCAALVGLLKTYDVPLWVKISPDLAAEQYAILMRVFSETGVRAVIATNTLGQPAPDDAKAQAGVGGGRLRPHALRAVELLAAHKVGDSVDIIGCGGLLDGASREEYARLGVQAVQYWSALVYRGPLAAALIERERKQRDQRIASRKSLAPN